MDALALIQRATRPVEKSLDVLFATTTGVRERFPIVPAHLPEFVTGYCRLAVADLDRSEDSPTNPLNIGEVVTSTQMPLMLTLQLAFQLDSDQRVQPYLYDDAFGLEITRLIQDTQAELLALSENMGEFICIHLETLPWQDGEVSTIAMRFHFPYCQIDRTYFTRTFVPHLIRLLRANKVLERMKVTPVGDWDTIIRPKEDVVPLYRSVGDGLNRPFIVAHYYGRIQPAQVEYGSAPDIDFEKNFLPHLHSWVRDRLLSEAIFREEGNQEHWLPMILSINYWPNVTPPKELLRQETLNVAPHPNDAQIGEKNHKAMLPNLLPLLGIHRFDTEPYWLDVGRAIHGVYNGEEEGLRIWIQNSTRATVDGRGEDECTIEWHQFQEHQVTIRTIGWYAREDSREEYCIWHDAWAQGSLMKAAATCTHGDVAEAIYRVFWLDYLCSDHGKNKWYKFVRTRLRPLDDAVELRIDISETLCKMYLNIVGKALTAAQRVTGAGETNGEKAQYQGISDKVNKLLRKLDMGGFKASCVGFAREKFYVPNFAEIRDTDPNKMAWNNCVVETCNGKAYPRPGKPEDYITMSTFQTMPRNMSMQHPQVMELLVWLNKVFPYPELLHYFLKDAASFLFGRNAEKFFRVWAGHGDNSKSMIVKLFQFVLGMYCVDFPVEMLSGKKFNSSGPNPELAQARGTHVAVICEPESGDDLRGGAIKRFTSGDRFFGRMCCENGGSIEAMFKLILMCNLVPNVEGLDKAVKNRLLVMPFVSTWSDHPPATEAEQVATHTFQKDPFFEKRIPKLAPAMAWLMVEYFTIYSREGLAPPAIVTEYTDAHWAANDPYRMFIRDRLENAHAVDTDGNRVLDASFTLSVGDIYNPFKLWFRDAFPQTPIPTLAMFGTQMKMADRLDNPGEKGRWSGVRMTQIQPVIPRL